MQISDRKIIGILIILQLVICIPFLNSFPIALDEPFSIYYSQQSLAEIWEMLSQENNPPLHFFLLHFWIKCFGIGVFSVRSLSLVFSIITIVPLFYLGKSLMSRKYAILVVLLFCFSNFNHYHALEARTYSLLVLLYVSIVWTIYRIVFEKKQLWLTLGVLNGLLLYTHYLAAFIIGVEFLILLLFMRQLTKRQGLFLVLSLIISGVIYIPGIILFMTRLGHFSNEGTWVVMPVYSELYGNIVRFMNGKIAVLILIGLTGGVAVLNRGVVLESLREKIKSKQAFFVVAAFLIPYCGMFLVSVVFQPVFIDRYLLYTTPVLYLIVVLLVEIVLKHYRFKQIWPLFLLPMLLTFNFKPELLRESDQIAKHIKSIEGESTVIVISPPFYDLTFLYHYDIEAFKNYQGKEDYIKNNQMIKAYGKGDLILDARSEHVIFLDANASFLYPENGIITELNKGYDCIDSARFKGNYSIFEFKKK